MTRRVRWVLVAYALGWAGFLALLWLARQHPYFGWDPVVAQAIQSIDGPVLDLVMRTVSAIGNEEVGIALIALTTAVALALRLWREAGLVLLSPLGGLLDYFAKLAGHRVRPQPGQLHVLVSVDSNSFPSGHTVFATYFLGLIILILLARAPAGLLRRAAIAGLILVILLVGVSRIYLGVHWPSDVLGGFWLGGLWLATIAAGFHWRRGLVGAPRSLARPA